MDCLPTHEELGAEIQELREKLQAKSNPDWISTLGTRKRRELEFHNSIRNEELVKTLSERGVEELFGNRKYYSTAGASREYVRQWLDRNVPGKIFLDFGCGDGGNAILAAQLGSALSVGIDISDVRVKNATKAARASGVEEKCVFVQGDCENTGLPDKCVDVVLCAGMLHHLDLSYVFPELRRILRRGGRILGLEALAYNPLIGIYRRLTPSLRTEWEAKHILSLKDLRFARRFFDIGAIRYWHLLSLLATPLRNNERWFKPVLSIMAQADSWLLRIPAIQLMSWMFTFELVRRNDD